MAPDELREIIEKDPVLAIVSYADLLTGAQLDYCLRKEPYMHWTMPGIDCHPRNSTIAAGTLRIPRWPITAITSVLSRLPSVWKMIRQQPCMRVSLHRIC